MTLDEIRRMANLFKQALTEVGETIALASEEALADAIDEAVRGVDLLPEFDVFAIWYLLWGRSRSPLEIQEDFLAVISAIGAAQKQQAWLADLGPLEPHDTSRPDWFIHSLPVDVARLMLKGRRGTAAALGLLYGISNGVCSERLIVLAKAWREGAYAQLSLAASANESVIPLGDVPSGDRLDLKALGDRYRAALASFDALLTDPELH